MPDNLPEISIDQIGFVFDRPNTGSLTTPDFTLPAAASAVTVPVMSFTEGVLPLGTALTFRAVGTNGSVASATQFVGTCPSAPGQGLTCADLTLNPGVIYQIVVYPETPFAMARIDSGPMPLAEQVLYASSGKDRVESEVKQTVPEEEISSPLEKWARAFGAEPQAHKKLAQLNRSGRELR